jgi:N-acetylglucosaminyldiphosphoundecaprenol N-acetyl-beta-D-mannosaminyltransferase
LRAASLYGAPSDISDNGRFPRVNVLGVGISAIDEVTALQQIERWVLRKERRYVCVCAVHIVMACQEDPSLRRIVNSSDLATPDGMPLVWLARLRGKRAVRRVYGPDLMLSFCELAAGKGYRSFLLGGAIDQPEQLADKLTRRFPGLQIAGTYSTPVRPLPPDENDRVIEAINAAQPDVVWVGMGTPNQERWMAANRHRLEAPVLIGVGAAFDFHSGWVPQAPLWMRRSGLEWLFRLSHEPRRLWKRYLLGNPLFILKVLRQQLWPGGYSIS